MSLILSGTDGLSDVDGSAATPAIRGTDANTGIFFGADIIGFSEGGAEVARFNADAQFVAAAGTALLPVITTTGDVNTGIFFPAADTIAFTEGGAEAMRIDSSGNVGIGTASPAYKLTVDHTSSLGFAVTRSAKYIGINANAAGSNAYSYIETDTGMALAFNTNGANERMRIDSSGNLLVGATSFPSSTSKFLVSGTAISQNGVIQIQSNTAGDTIHPGLYLSKFDNNTTTSQILIRFAINNYGAGQGQITANGVNAAAFGTFSDSRLKENIVDLPSQLSNIMALRPVEYDYIASEGGGHQIGFVAQEVQAVYPDLVGEREDGMLTLSDMNKNDARLIKAIQEQQALITALTARITALETP
jgi:trimeric autotransporter adhesin